MHRIIFTMTRRKTKAYVKSKVSKEDKEVMCGKELNGVFATNIKKNLQQKHKESFKEFEEQEKLREIKESSQRKKKCQSKKHSSQASIPMIQRSSWPFPKFIGPTNMPLTLVDCPEFS